MKCQGIKKTVIHESRPVIQKICALIEKNMYSGPPPLFFNDHLPTTATNSSKTTTYPYFLQMDPCTLMYDQLMRYVWLACVSFLYLPEPKGAYLLRPSERVPGNYTLYVVCSDAPNHHIKRFQIVVEGSKLCMGTQLTIKFNTIDEIVTRYRSREIALDCCLTMPILKVSWISFHLNYKSISHF